jgi:hypothetical protein
MCCEGVDPGEKKTGRGMVGGPRVKENGPTGKREGGKEMGLVFFKKLFFKTFSNFKHFKHFSNSFQNFQTILKTFKTSHKHT